MTGWAGVIESGRSVGRGKRYQWKERWSYFLRGSIPVGEQSIPTERAQSAEGGAATHLCGMRRPVGGRVGNGSGRPNRASIFHRSPS
eukprot:1468479-Prymnesium_polylepis.1